MSPHSHPELDSTGQRLLDAAEVVFAEVGYKAASVRDICQRAEVKNVGAVNYYFQGKEKLYRATVFRAFQFCQEGAPFPHWPSGTPPEKKLRDFIEVMTARMLQIPRVSAMQLMMREMSQPTPICREAVLQNIHPMAQNLHQILLELLPGLSQHQERLICFSIVGQCLFYRQNRTVIEILIEEGWKKAEGQQPVTKVIPLTVEEVADHIKHFTFAALGLAEPITGKLGSSSKSSSSRNPK